MTLWMLSSSTCKHALAVVDGTGQHSLHGPHYSRRTPGSRSFTGVGQEVVFVTRDRSAVWAVVRQRTPLARGSGSSRGRAGARDSRANYVWRNMLFRNLGKHLSSELIRQATELTYTHWVKRYGSLPSQRLRTEVDTRRVRSANPGYCYMCAGWEKGETKRGKLFLYAPRPAE